MIALDLDGTLLDYSTESPSPRFNYGVLSWLMSGGGERSIAICTNQGGLPFGVMGAVRRDGRPYPLPAQFVARLQFAYDELRRYGAYVVALRVSVYHPKAPVAAIRTAAQQVRDLLQQTEITREPHRPESRGFGNRRVYTTAAARKPSPLMLRSVGATEYWGDSDEDEGAARAAGIPFVRVARFL